MSYKYSLDKWMEYPKSNKTKYNHKMKTNKNTNKILNAELIETELQFTF